MIKAITAVSQAVASTSRTSLETKATEVTISPTTVVAAFHTTFETSVVSKEIVPQQTPLPSSSPNFPSINAVSVDSFLTTVIGSSNENQLSTNNPWVVVAAVLAVLVVTIITTTIAVTLVTAIMIKRKKMKCCLAKPRNEKNGKKLSDDNFICLLA